MHLRLNTIPFLGMLLAFSLFVPIANAGTVTLRSLDGSVAMKGELVGFDGDFYVLEVILGQLEVAVSEVTCEGDFCPEIIETNFRLTGTNALAKGLIPNLFQDYSNINDLSLTSDDVDSNSDDPVQSFLFSDLSGEVYADVDVRAQGSQAALIALLDGTAEIAASSRAIATAELAAFKDAGLGDLTDESNQVVVALDGLIIIVSPENNIPTLSLQELAQIFSGRISNWASIGGNDAPINVYLRDDAVNHESDFATVVLAPTGATYASNAMTFADNGELVRAVTDDQNGIGFTSIAYQDNSRAVPVRGTCGFISTPSEFTVKTGDYPLARRVYLYTTNRLYDENSDGKSDKTMDFLDFVQSDAGQVAVESSYARKLVTADQAAF